MVVDGSSRFAAHRVETEPHLLAPPWHRPPGLLCAEQTKDKEQYTWFSDQIALRLGSSKPALNGSKGSIRHSALGEDITHF